MPKSKRKVDTERDIATAQTRDWAVRGHQAVTLLEQRGFITPNQAEFIRAKIRKTIGG